MSAEYQYIFNIIFGLFQGVVLFLSGYILTSIRSEMNRIHRRIDELRDSNTDDHNAIRAEQGLQSRSLPEAYIPRAEYRQMIEMMQEDRREIKAALVRIEDRLNNLK